MKKIAVDTNLLVRVIVKDDGLQTQRAQNELERADLVAIPLVALCEFVWVLGSGYKIPRHGIADAIRKLVNAENVSTNAAAVEAGLAMMDQGGDFADGVMAFEGEWLGAAQFVTFDKDAVALLTKSGVSARLVE